MREAVFPSQESLCFLLLVDRFLYRAVIFVQESATPTGYLMFFWQSAISAGKKCLYLFKKKSLYHGKRFVYCFKIK